MKYHSVSPSSSPNVRTLRSSPPPLPAPPLAPLRHAHHHRRPRPPLAPPPSLASPRPPPAHFPPAHFPPASSSAHSEKYTTGMGAGDSSRWLAYVPPHFLGSTSRHGDAPRAGLRRERGDEAPVPPGAYAAQRRHRSSRRSTRAARAAATRISSRRLRETRDVPESGDQRYRSTGSAGVPARANALAFSRGAFFASLSFSAASFSRSASASSSAFRNASTCAWKKTRSSPSPSSGRRSTNPPTGVEEFPRDAPRRHLHRRLAKLLQPQPLRVAQRVGPTARSVPSTPAGGAASSSPTIARAGGAARAPPARRPFPAS